MKPGRFGNTLSIGLHIQVTFDPGRDFCTWEVSPVADVCVCVCLQLNEALCASSPDLASPCDYQSPVDSMNTLTLPVRSPRRRSMGVSQTLN